MCQAIRDFLPDDCPQVPDDPAVNVFTVGYSGAGKSSLVKSLKQNAKGGISSFMAQIRKVSAETKTAGIKPYMIKHANIGKLQVYDLAGDEEFYSSHDAIISTSLSGPSSAVFLLVVSLQWSPKEIEKSLLYWLNFLRAKIPPNQHIPPHLLCIGSHLDLAGNMLERNVVFDTFLPIARASGFSVRGYIHMNCRFSKSDGMTRLKQMLAASFQGLHVVESMSFNAHCFHIFLLSIASNNPAIQLKTVLERSTTCNNCDGVLSFLPTRLEDLAILCDELSRRNLVLFLKSNEALVESWIVVDHKVLLSQVNGIVFSPKHFRTYRELASSTGVVPLSKLAAEFSDLDSSMITQYLTHLHYCTELDQKTLNLLQPSASFDPSETYFFFPSLITEQMPANVWAPDERYVEHGGWEIECSNPEQFLVPHFLHLLLLRIAFRFALSHTSDADDLTIHRSCNIWKNGIHWKSEDLVSGLIEVTNHGKKVTVFVRSYKEGKINMMPLLAAIVREILDTKEEVCPAININECFLQSKVTISYPMEESAYKSFITGSRLIDAIARNKPGIVTIGYNMVPLKEIFPYTTKTQLMNKKICEDDPEHGHPIPQQWLTYLCENIQSNNFFVATSRTGQQRPSLVQQALLQIIQEWEENGCLATYSNLRNMIHQYGVFSLLVGFTALDSCTKRLCTYL